MTGRVEYMPDAPLMVCYCYYYHKHAPNTSLAFLTGHLHFTRSGDPVTLCLLLLPSAQTTVADITVIQVNVKIYQHHSTLASTDRPLSAQLWVFVITELT